MSRLERARFWSLITGHDDNKMIDLILSTVIQAAHTHTKALKETNEEFAGRVRELAAQLLKHRKPARNAERDAEIMRLHGEKKTDGGIVRALRAIYPNLTTGQVRAVISRHRKSKPEAHGS